MSYENPYSPPAARVNDPTSDIDGRLLDSPRGVPVGHGWSWLAEGFALFKQAPGVWIAIVILMIVIFVIIGLIPLLGSLLPSLLGTVVSGGIVLGCYALDRGDGLKVEHLFAGFTTRFGGLFALGAIYLFGSAALFALSFTLTGAGMDMFSAMMTGDMTPEQSQAIGMSFLLAILIGMALALPLMMAIWFAPALLVLQPQVTVPEALKLSLIGCLKNVLPLLWFGVVLMVLAILATLPLGLGWLVLLPMLYGASYAGYKDIFLD